MRKMIYIFIEPPVFLTSCKLKFSKGLLTLVEYQGEPKYEMSYNDEGELVYYKDWKGNWYDKSLFKGPYSYFKTFYCFEIYGIDKYTNVALMHIGQAAENQARKVKLHKDTFLQHMNKIVNQHGLLNSSVIATNTDEVCVENYFQFNDILDRLNKAKVFDFVSFYLTFNKYIKVVYEKRKE